MFDGARQCPGTGGKMKLNGVTINVLVKGRSVDEYQHNGNVWIEGRPNSEYSIKLKNTTHKPRQVIVSVDGLDVLTGNPAGIHSPAFSLDPYESYEISGWSTKLGEVARFVFSKLSGKSGKSTYSNMKQSLGSIGFVVSGKSEEPFVAPHWRDYLDKNNWNEIAKPRKNLDLIYEYRGANTPAMNSTSRSTQVGTGWGDRKSVPRQKVTQVFDSDNTMGAIFYDTRRGLIERGIIVQEKSDLPNPFPGIGCEPPDEQIKITVDDFLKSIRDIPEPGCYDGLSVKELSWRIKLAYELKGTRTAGIQHLGSHLQELTNALVNK